MRRIAIVDDSPLDRTAVKLLLAEEMPRRGEEYSTEEFADGESFLAALPDKRYDIAFLDIYMGKVSGMTAAQELFCRDEHCRIVFLTSSTEYSVAGYAVRAAHYLLKPVVAAQFRQALDFCLPRPKAGDLLAIHNGRDTTVVDRGEILYLEYINRRGLVHLADRVLSCTETFAEMTPPLQGDRNFLLCYRGIMVNMRKIREKTGADFILANGEKVPVSRRNRREVLAVYDTFELENM